MSKVIKKPTQTKKRKPLLVVTKPPMMGNGDMTQLQGVETKATAMGYDVLMLPFGASAYVSVTA